MIAATIDIGTNAVLLLVARFDGGAQLIAPLHVIRDEARITRLGEGLHRQPPFLPQAEERTLKVLREYREICDRHGVTKIAAVGTAAFRKAKNAAAFIDRIRKETGIAIEVISGDEEARLSYLSVEKDFGDAVALDIGGGSTEIIAKDGAISLDLGAVVLTERFVKQDPPTEGEVLAMEKEIDKTITGRVLSLRKGFAGLLKRRRQKPFLVPPDLLPDRSADLSPDRLIGLAGSVTTLSAIKQKLAVWDGAKVQGSRLTLADLDEMIFRFRRMTHDALRMTVGMVPGREDTILAGTLILKAVMEKLGVGEVVVSDRGLRYGLFYERFPATTAP